MTSPAGTPGPAGQPLDAFDLSGQVAVVTGAGSGIGAASARTLAAAGAFVVCADIDDDGARQTVKAIEDQGGRAEALQLDVSDEQRTLRVGADVARQHGRLDVWCNSAGIIDNVLIADLTDAAFRRIFDVNFVGTLHGCRSALKAMTAGDGQRRVAGRPTRGSIVNISSAAIDTPAASIAAYAVSKAGVTQLTRTLAVEAGPLGVRVNAVAPGFVISNMTSRHFTRPDGSIDEPIRDQVVGTNTRMSPLGMIGDPMDMAYAVLYLSSRAAEFMTGQIVRPNGGVAMPW